MRTRIKKTKFGYLPQVKGDSIFSPWRTIQYVWVHNESIDSVLSHNDIRVVYGTPFIKDIEYAQFAIDAAGIQLKLLGEIYRLKDVFPILNTPQDDILGRIRR